VALFRHVVQGVFPGEVWTFGIHTQGSITIDAASSAFTTAFASFWSTELAAVYCTDVQVQALITAELTQATGKQITRREATVSHVGTNATACLPFQCAPVVTQRIALAQKGRISRFYAPSPAVDQQSAGRLITTAQTALRDSTVAMYNALTSAGLEGVLYSRKTFDVQPITQISVGDVIDTQRRRRNKLIENRITGNV